MGYAPTLIRDAAEVVVDPSADGLTIKSSCRLATAAALPANTPAGAGIGKTLTANANGALSVDGTTPSASDRILVKDESGGTSIHNGIYTVTQVGDGSNPWILTRATDADETAEVAQGMFTFVREGTANANESFTLITEGSITVDTTALTFSEFAGEWDVPTLAAGIARLPAGGGTIVLRAGTHNVDSTIAMPDKDIVFRGSGVGSTIISFTNNSPLFTTGSNVRHYTFEDIEFQGNSAPLQELIDCDNVIVDFLRSKMTAIESIIDATANTKVMMRDVEMTSTSSTNWSFWKGGAGLLVWHWVRVDITDPTSLAMQDNPQWCVVNSYMTGGGGDVSLCEIGRFVAYSFEANALDLEVRGADSFVFGMKGTDTDLTFHTNADDSVLVGCHFDYPTAFTSNIGILFNASARCKAVGCSFSYVANAIGVALSCQNGGTGRGHTITGCTFSGTNIGLQFIDSDNIATGNYFSSGLATPIDEFGSPNTNVITGNHGIEGSDTIGDRTKIDGKSVRAITSSPITADEHDHTFLIDSAGGTRTINLPPAGDVTYKEYLFKKTNAGGNIITIDPDGTETIDGALTKSLTSQYEFFKIISDGSNWFITAAG